MLDNKWVVIITGGKNKKSTNCNPSFFLHHRYRYLCNFAALFAEMVFNGLRAMAGGNAKKTLLKSSGVYEKSIHLVDPFRLHCF